MRTRVKPRAEAGFTKSSAGMAGGSNSSSNSSSSSKTLQKPRGRPPKDGGASKSAARHVPQRPFVLTANRVANIISQLDNKRGSTMESIRSKLVREGHSTKTAAIRLALERAVSAGILKEVREERFSLPKSHAAQSQSSSSSSSSRNKVARRLSSTSQRKLKGSSSAVKSGSSADAKKRQRRPPQGRRPAANQDGGAPDNGEDGRNDDDETGMGDGDVDDQGNDATEKRSSRVSMSEPVAGCDAVMVFGTH